MAKLKFIPLQTGIVGQDNRVARLNTASQIKPIKSKTFLIDCVGRNINSSIHFELGITNK